MANNNQHQGQNPFWDFVQSFDPNASQNRAGAGVDHASSGPAFPAGFPFAFGGPGGFNPWAGGQGWGRHSGPPGDFPWGRGAGRHGRHGRRHRHGEGSDSDREGNEFGGRHGRHGRHHHERDGSGSDRDGSDSEAHDFDMADTPDTMREDGPSEHRGPPPPPEGPGGPPHPPHAAHDGPRHHGHHRHGGPHAKSHGGPHGGSRGGPRGGPHGGPGGPGGPGAFGKRGGCRGRGGFRGRHGSPPPMPPPNGAFDLRALLQAIGGHPAAQAWRGYFDPATATNDESAEQAKEQNDSFVPPVDIFSTEKAYVLHISVPGAVKEDVGVHWDAEKSQLNVAGVVYRPGNEEFLQSLTSSERKVGMFERSIKLPPTGSSEKEEVDGVGITAKMENGVLIVTVPKAEKEWTEIQKIDIQ